MPRRSAASLAIVPPYMPGRSRLEPLASLTPGQQKVWRTLTESLPADYWGPEARHLLAQYCRHADRCDQIERMIEAMDAADVDGFEKLSRLAIAESSHVASLGRALRINTNTRVRPDVAAHRAARTPAARGIECLFEQ